MNSIAPGYLETEMTGVLAESQKSQIVRRTPLGRLGAPSDVVGAVKFLLSEGASFITGHRSLSAAELRVEGWSRSLDW